MWSPILCDPTGTRTVNIMVYIGYGLYTLKDHEVFPTLQGQKALVEAIDANAIKFQPLELENILLIEYL